MDFSNLKGLLETNRSESLELSDNDLEDELNAIISGHSVGVKSKQTATTSVANVKRVKQSDTKVNKNQNPSKTNNKLNDSQNELMFSDDLLNIDKLGIIEDIMDDDIDEDDEDLLSEIHAIASNKSGFKGVPKSDAFKTPEVDYEVETRSQSKERDRPLIQPLIQPIYSEPKDSIREEDMSPKRSSFQKQSIETNSQILIPNINRFDQNIEFSKNQNITTDNRSDISRLNYLKDQYKREALNAKKSGQPSIALSHIKTAKQIEVLIKAIEEGKPVDLSQLPPPPTASGPNPTVTQVKVESQASDQIKMNPEIGFEIDIENVELTTEDAKKFFNAPPPPNSVMEALEQRLSKFKSTLELANEENNTSKARRLGRIVKQYENAIKDVKKGKVVDFEELPTPPGFGPIPVANDSKADKTPIESKSESIKSSPLPKPLPKPQPKPSENPVINPNKSPQKPEMETTPPKTSQRPPLKRATSSANKQLNYLLERQRLFKEAALESKQKGDIQQAKEYLRAAKGFDPLIEATQNGLPIDATSIPTPPQMNEDFVIVSHPEVSETEDLEKEEIYRKIEVEIQNQIEMCKRNKEYFLQLGDISTASKFEKYAIDSRKDLDILTIRWRNGQKVPEIKYETRTFSVVICNPEVSTNEVSVEIVKALDIPGKPDIDTYVRLEFPFPNDTKQTNKTKTVKNSINPVFNQTFKFDIDRKSRTLPRIFKRHPLKLELMSKGGFLRNDSLIGTVLIKLIDFETKCTIHESFQLTEPNGRKLIGGRIEAKVRIREPLLSKQVEEVKEKWISFV